MNFFKQAQELAAAVNTNTDNQPGGAAPASGGFGSFMSDAEQMLQSQSGAPASAPAGAPAHGAEQGTLPGGRQPPSNAELLDSTKLLFEAAQGQKVGNQQLAGAASTLLGGLAAHGNLDQGQYATYVNQAEQYLQNYSREGQSSATSAPAPDTKPAPAPDTKPAPAPDTKPAPAPDTKPAPAPSTKPAPAPSTKPAPAPAGPALDDPADQAAPPAGDHQQAAPATQDDADAAAPDASAPSADGSDAYGSGY